MPPLPLSLQKEPTERLAISLFDLDRVDPGFYQRLLAGRLDLQKESIVKVDSNRPDETAVPFKCSVLEAALACDVIRIDNRKEGDRVTRVYINRGRSWSRVASQTDLVVSVQNTEGRWEARLNPEIFPSQVVLAPVKPLAPTRVL